MSSTTTSLTPQQLGILFALANGIIPADKTDAGAAAVNAAPRLAGRIHEGINATLYLQGIEFATQLAQGKFATDPTKLRGHEMHDLLALIRERQPGFFKQLRADVCALYLSDPGVWQRIGFPGPATASGGYSDFDQPQTIKQTQLKEPRA